MRHQKNKVTLDRKTAARRSLLANLAESLVLYEKIKTTKAKAKALAPFVARLITKAKLQTLAGRRELMKVLYTENAIKKLMEVIAPKYKDREGGYTRIIMLKNRKGDGAEEVLIELV
ncbi:MAG: 50S ribosomal protein L17 [Candidatus Magasanikbacteria bacterium GW2011_GWA2_40_10]|uniref:50S ribosomal protein L17 n=1 Tax=Candidatus Magasanikbacteria bacterium GW2011_GWA2_40_10 TaxID=1619037 RepID=A0A0G0Q2P6_9BACT|nr:MAG: 50S ribosomal protein L17 [Candidatus Magasanikbacteria bacterium GW2011_GWA2_40_10]